MKHPKSEPLFTQLDPNHPNYDAILLKRSRLEAHRRRRMENSGQIALREWPQPPAKNGKKPRSRSKVLSHAKD